MAMTKHHMSGISGAWIRSGFGAPRGVARLVLAAALAAGIISLLSCVPVAPSGTQIPLSQAISLSETGNIQKAVADSNTGTMTITAAVAENATATVTDVNGASVPVKDGDQLVTNIDSLKLNDLQQLGFVPPADFSTSAVSTSSSWLGILSIVLPLLLIAGIGYWLLRSGRNVQNQALSFGRSRAKLQNVAKPSITFADVAGSEEAKQDLIEIVDFLKDRRKFQAMGAKIPKGVLLVGPPGTGKTLLARAVAGEANVPFFSVSGSEFVELFVGIGASRVRDLFGEAKKAAPSIVFIDEIDAVGRQRSGSVPGSHEEREQTLNQILTEMDGFDPNLGVIVLAATNRPDVLDPALLRPGRFDRRVTLDLPDTNGRAAILKIHAAGKPVDPSVDLGTIAKETHGFSGADLADLMNEGAILAVRRNLKTIGIAELDDAIDRIVAGPERKSIRVNQKDKERTAYHEAGHALVAHMLPDTDPVHKISIVARGSMGGYTRLLTEDRYFITASQFRETLATLLAGHSAEEMMFQEVSTGPHSDIKQATALALRMVTDYGMSNRLGLRTFGQEVASSYLGFGPPKEKDYSEETARRIDEEVNRIVEDAHQVAKKILAENKPRLMHVTERLLAKETLEGADLQAAFTDPLPVQAAPAQSQKQEAPIPGVSGIAQ